MTLESVLNLGAAPSLVNKDFSLHGWRKSIKSMKLIILRKKEWEVVNVEDLVPLLIRIGNLHYSASFGIVKSIAVDIML